MKKFIPIALFLLSYGSATNAQQTNIDLSKTETATTETPVGKIRTNYFSPDKNLYQSLPDPTPVHDEAFYLKKSRNNRIASICLAGGGLVIGGIGALTFPKDYDLIFDNGSSKESQADVSTTLIIVGSAALIASIPFTVMASVNKRKANLMVTSQKTGFGVPANVSKDIVGITLQIPLGK